jgi:hypothetical protein
MRLTRRTFLYTTAAAAALVAAPFVWHGRISVVIQEADEFAEFLRTPFHYVELEISDSEFESFYSSYREHYGPVSRRPLWQRILNGHDDSQHRKAMDSLATRFLMSTDFFLHNADETRPVHYLALYHPYATPCWNPLSSAEYPPRS